MPDPGRDVPLQNIAQALGALGPSLAAALSAASLSIVSLQTYSTGTWVPTLTFGGSASGMTLTSSGTYRHIGSEYWCDFTALLSAKGSATGPAVLGGLPASSGSEIGAGGMIFTYSSMASLTGPIFLSIGSSASSGSLSQAGSQSSLALTDANFTNNSRISGSFTFAT